MSEGKTAIFFVTDINPQTQLFINYLAEQLEQQIAAVEPHDIIDNVNGEKVLVLLDTDHIDEGIIQQWHGRAAESQSLTLAALNLRDEDHAADILASLHLQGVFYRHDKLELICKGINTLLKGDLWLSRSLMTRLIEFYRRQQLNAYRPVCGLTHRELEIIGLLGSGASNTEIADKLSVSEHTVKSHLYNIFRKIKVKNRIQAMNWARQNLGAPPSSYQKPHPR